MELIKNFVANDDGAVTVDWVVLTAGIVTLAIASAGVVTSGTEEISNDVDEKLQSQLISTTF